MPYCTNLGFIPNDRPTANVLMQIIIYSTVYKKKCICIRIGSAGLYIYFGIRATVKLLEKKKGMLHFILVSELQLNC